jgi:hypothetical protein
MSDPLFYRGQLHIITIQMRQAGVIILHDIELAIFKLVQNKFFHRTLGLPFFETILHKGKISEIRTVIKSIFLTPINVSQDIPLRD